MGDGGEWTDTHTHTLITDTQDTPFMRKVSLSRSSFKTFRFSAERSLKSFHLLSISCVCVCVCVCMSVCVCACVCVCECAGERAHVCVQAYAGVCSLRVCERV